MRRLLRSLVAAAYLLALTALPIAAEMRFPPAVSDITYKSGVPVTHTGDLVAFDLATVTIPGGSLGPNGYIVIKANFSYTNSANNKVLAVLFGGTTFLTATVTTTVNDRVFVEIHNRGSVSSQVASPSLLVTFGTSTSAVVTSAINTANNQTVVFRGTLSNAAETVALEWYSIEVHYGN